MNKNSLKNMAIIAALAFGSFWSTAGTSLPAPSAAPVGVDLVITNVTLAPTTPDPTLPFDITITLLNQGDVASGSIVYADFYKDNDPTIGIDPDGCVTIPRQTWQQNNNTQLDPGQSTTVTFTIPALGPGSHKIWAYVDASCIQDEANLSGTAETNNSYGPLNITNGTDSALDISISGTVKGSYPVLKDDYLLKTYPGVFGGPVLADSTNGVPIVSSLRLLYLNQFGYNTLSELMGVPTSQLLDNYWMPLYLDNAVMDSQIRFTNTSPTLSTNISVYIGGVLKGTYNLGPNSATRVRYEGFSGGPVQIVGTPGVPILAGMRIIYAGGNSFDEIMAYPTTQLSNEYWFPFYNHNNANLDTEIRVGNTSTSTSSTVNIYIGGALKGTYTLAPSTSQQISYPGFSGGPVHIIGTAGVNLVTSIRLLYLNQFSVNTLSELMGVPTAGLLDDYSMPVYLDDSVMDSQVRFTNTSTTLSTTVKVYLGGVLMGTYPLGPSSANRIRFMGTSDGPVRIVGTPGVPILAGMRIIYGGGNSFDEIMAYPTTQLSAEYWFPFYNHNNVNLDTEMRAGTP